MKDLMKNREVAMWSHYCREEGCTMEVGKGEECNWCGATEINTHTPVDAPVNEI